MIMDLGNLGYLIGMVKQLYYRLMDKTKKSIDDDNVTSRSNFHKLTDGQISLSSFIFLEAGTMLYDGVHYNRKDLVGNERTKQNIFTNKYIIYICEDVNGEPAIGIVLSIKPDSGEVPFLMTYTKNGEVVGKPEFINLVGSGMRESTIKYKKGETIELAKAFLSKVDEIIHTEEIRGMYDHDNVIGCIYKPDCINVRHTDGYVYKLELE